MNPFFTILMIGMILLLTAYISGCDSDEKIAEEVPIISFVRANPSPGDIDPNSTITVTFDSVPADVKVTAGAARIG